MKVLQINSVCGVGSTGRIATDLADILAEQGHECRIAYGRGTVPERYRDIAVRIGTDMDVRIHGVQTRLFDLHGFGSRTATKKFLAWVWEYDPDVIHLHNIHGYYINIELLFDYLKQAGKPVFWTLHDCWAFTGHCAHFLEAKCEQWKTGCQTCTQLKKYPTCMGLGNVVRNYERKKELFTEVPNLTVITPSEWLAGLVRESFLGVYPVHVIPNGIDLSVFRPTEGNVREKYSLSDKKVVLGVANVWGKSKGLYDFFKLSEILEESYQVVLVGLTSEQVKELPPKILGVTRTDSTQELAEFYSAADIFVNPTYADNFPTTNIEALACGTPVITYRTGGSVEAVTPDCGYIVEVGDVRGLKRAIEQSSYWAEDCVERAKMFDKCGQYLKYLRHYGG